MFTGIISGMGRVKAALAPQDSCREMVVTLSTPYCDTELGESIAINGVCLTVAAQKPEGLLTFFVSPETMECTNLSHLKEDDYVNLERAMRLSDRLSGHLVQGHVDGVAKLASITQQGECFELAIELPSNLAKYAIPKGSITVDGISLTINKIEKHQINTTIYLMIIPHTWQETTLKYKRVGQIFNIEADVIAKMVEKFVSHWESNVRNA